MQQLAQEHPASLHAGHNGLLEYLNNPEVQMITLTGPSGAGKDAMKRILHEREPRFQNMLSYTTRPTRDDDRPGEYCYVTQEEFRHMRDEAGALQWAIEAHGHWYGTKKDDINRALQTPFPTLMHLVPQCVPILHQYAPGRIVSFFVYVSEQEILRARLKKRDVGKSEAYYDERVHSCLNWYQEARDSGLPYIFIDNSYQLDQAVGLVINKLRCPSQFCR